MLAMQRDSCHELPLEPLEKRGEGEFEKALVSASSVFSHQPLVKLLGEERAVTTLRAIPTLVIKCDFVSLI